MGKWVKLKGKYDTTFYNKDQSSDISFQKSVDEKKKELSKLTLADLFAKHEEARKLKEQIAADERLNNVALSALGMLIHEKFTADGVTSMSNDFGRTVYLEIVPIISVEDSAESRKFFEEHPETGVQLTPVTGTIKTWVKGLLDEDRDDDIPSFLKVLLQTTVKSRKS